jgi:hypothetical protein
MCISDKTQIAICVISISYQLLIKYYFHFFFKYFKMFLQFVGLVGQNKQTVINMTLTSEHSLQKV